MTVAWSVTEIIRYAFYFFALLGGVPSLLNYLRYTLFYVLYPLGAGSEMVLLFKSLPFAKKYSTLLYVFDVVLLAIYPPGWLAVRGMRFLLNGGYLTCPSRSTLQSSCSSTLT